jgi:hypothetical protein
MARSGDRLVAAFVLPKSEKRGSEDGVLVSVIDDTGGAQ